MKNDTREAMPPQIPREPLLMPNESRWSAGPRKRSCEIQMETRVDSSLPRDSRGSFRILHEHHCAHRGNGTAVDAIQGPVGVFCVSPPIVRVPDQNSGVS